jgi:hypothetical protein
MVPVERIAGLPSRAQGELRRSQHGARLVSARIWEQRLPSKSRRAESALQRRAHPLGHAGERLGQGPRLDGAMVREMASTDKSLPPDTTTITMDWLLGFSDVSAAYGHLTDPRVWPIQNGYNSQGSWTSPIERLCAQLAKRGLLTGSREIRRSERLSTATSLIQTTDR